MAFKMKGPGLPGFRKNAGSGFYKSSGFNINTSNRSPMKENGEGWEEDKSKSAEELARDKWDELVRQGVKEEDIDWGELVVESNTEVRNNETITKTKEGQWGVKKGKKYEGPMMPDEQYQAKIDAGWVDPWKKKHPDEKVYRGSEKIEITKPDPEKEWTNVRINVSRTGLGSGVVKKDQDGSFRQNLSLNNGRRFGEISRNDIDDLVDKGHFKYELDKTGTPTGNLLMSKDYHENTHVPMLEMEATGERNRTQWQKERNTYITAMPRHIEEQLAKQGISERDKNYNEVKREFINEYKGARSDIWNKQERNGIVSYNTYGDNPPWMKGDPNYGGVTAGIYNDDEVLQGSGDPKLLKTNANFYGNENLQGSRARDWELNKETGKYQLKDGALTLDPNTWNSLKPDEKKQYMLNGVNPGKDNPKAKISHPDEKTEDEFTSGGDESVRINEREI